jgi:heptaprenyl diphosphate synthase
VEIRKLTTLAMLISLAVVLNIIESTIPFVSSMIPGVKLGLANTIVIIVIYTYSFSDAMYVSVGRVFLVGLIRTGLFGVSFFLSLSGAILSTIAMYLAKKYTKLSIVGVSILGALYHSAGQVLMAILLLKTTNIIFYLPYILLFAIPTGIVVGTIARTVLPLIERKDIAILN